jgi:hypothetical protein
MERMVTPSFGILIFRLAAPMHGVERGERVLHAKKVQEML